MYGQMCDKKICDPISFPIQGLDITPYVLDKPENDGQKLIYDLYGVINHSGTLNYGHYTALVQNSKSGHWNLFNDEKHHLCNPSQIMNLFKDAYTLFYKRRDPGQY